MSTVTDVVVAALRAAGIATGDGVARVGTTDLAPPYVVVYPFTRSVDGTAVDGNADSSPVLQFTAVGKTRGSAEATAADVEAVIRGVLPPPAGMAWAGQPGHVLSQGVRRDDAVVPPLFYGVEQWRFPLTPA